MSQEKKAREATFLFRDYCSYNHSIVIDTDGKWDIITKTKKKEKTVMPITNLKRLTVTPDNHIFLSRTQTGEEGDETIATAHLIALKTLGKKFKKFIEAAEQHNELSAISDEWLDEFITRSWSVDSDEEFPYCLEEAVRLYKATNK